MLGWGGAGCRQGAEPGLIYTLPPTHSKNTLHDVCYKGERIIQYSNNIRITNIRIRIRPQIETQILFVFVQKFGSEYYSYSYLSKNLGPNIIRILIRLF